MINQNYYMAYDLETTGPNPLYDFPIEIAAVPLDPNKLETLKDNDGKDVNFYSLVKIPDFFLEEADKDPAKKKSLDGALGINGKTLADLEDAPDLRTVWSNFVDFCQQYSTKPSDAWRSVIPVTYNGNSFDNVLMNRLAREFKTVDGQGNPILFHKNISIDLYQDMFRWTEKMKDPFRINLDTIRQWTGYPEGQAHTAMYDTYTVIHLFQKLQHKQREISKAIHLKDCFIRKPIGS